MHLGLPTWLPHLSTVHVLGLVSLLFAATGSIPQLVRIRATRDVAGVNVVALVNSLVSLAAWVAYGFYLHDWWVITQSFAGLVPTVLTVAVALRSGAGRPNLRLPALWAAILLTATGASAIFGVAVITVVLGCSVMWLVAPATFTAWRSADVSGIAWGTWALLAGNGIITGAYGLVAGVPANVVYAAVAICGSAAILARIALAGRTAGRSLEPALP